MADPFEVLIRWSAGKLGPLETWLITAIFIILICASLAKERRETLRECPTARNMSREGHPSARIANVTFRPLSRQGDLDRRSSRLPWSLATANATVENRAPRIKSLH